MYMLEVQKVGRVPYSFFKSLQQLITVQPEFTTVFHHAKYQYCCRDGYINGGDPPFFVKGYLHQTTSRTL